MDESLIPSGEDLIRTARSLVRKQKLGESSSAGGVGAALRTREGNVYTGVCIDMPSGLGFCAEVAAIAQMITKGETQIDAIVAVTEESILPPCGRCRETMAQVDARNLDATVIIEDGLEVSLRTLLPHPWT